MQKEARDVDICYATTFPTKNHKSEPDAATGKELHSVNSSQQTVRKNMWDPEQSSPNKMNPLESMHTSGSMGLQDHKQKGECEGNSIIDKTR